MTLLFKGAAIPAVRHRDHARRVALTGLPTNLWRMAMSDSTNRDPGDNWPWAPLMKLLGDTFIPIPSARAQATRAAPRDGGGYPAAPPGYSEAFGSGAQYTAFRLGTALFITAQGTLGNYNEIADIRQAPIRIYPPAFDFLVYSPQITPPALRPFHFTVMVAYPKGPETVLIRDAQGSHQVEIKGLQVSKTLASLVGDSAEEGFGMGVSIEEAVDAAIAAIPAAPSPMPDVMHCYSITDSGKMVGGFAGLNLYFARINRTSP
ncbi:hypothetical protein J2X20_001206 [Pelomonas saccharophila]|uniref:Uncharacterized protein n=1 Tax=Roseateles saccharophilus TaxID=304 RepID=A0ABU1YI94_ROSSA|nr:hypothetical protein [Roseateles saccharophilus]MDR7268577.1 hypothetical protein [Roseateles saccharophilus]